MHSPTAEGSMFPPVLRGILKSFRAMWEIADVEVDEVETENTHNKKTEITPFSGKDTWNAPIITDVDGVNTSKYRRVDVPCECLARRKRPPAWE
ncbi:hypothetical protein EYF80_009853 [Liparis tanakae]|uniref:Uncharacterized protein n=1 Tax=Liparis tanakae TaxID=230148 RepID=A0A4Z2IPM3_9TELE|nr:hypothetical protein EYF80_009853 [Liparis tanakae]